MDSIKGIKKGNCKRMACQRSQRINWRRRMFH